MSFSCSLDRRGLKSFRSTLASLAKVGSEVNLEATPDSLLVRALAPSHAAFALVTLRRGFFVPHSFESRPMTSSQLSAPPQTVGASQSQSQSHTFIKCKVSLKQVMVVFRNSHAAERMDIELSTKENKMWCHLQVGGVLTRYGSEADKSEASEADAPSHRRCDIGNLSHFIDGEIFLRFLVSCPALLLFSVPFESQSNILQADFHSSAADSFLVFKSNLLSRALDNFTARTAEVTLVIDAMETPEREMAVEPMIRLKNFEQNQAHTHTAGLSLLQETMNTESDIPQSQLEACHVRRRQGEESPVACESNRSGSPSFRSP